MLSRPSLMGGASLTREGRESMPRAAQLLLGIALL
jgi:hypothetical protein